MISFCIADASDSSEAVKHRQITLRERVSASVSVQELLEILDGQVENAGRLVLLSALHSLAKLVPKDFRHLFADHPSVHHIRNNLEENFHMESWATKSIANLLHSQSRWMLAPSLVELAVQELNRPDLTFDTFQVTLTSVSLIKIGITNTPFLVKVLKCIEGESIVGFPTLTDFNTSDLCRLAWGFKSLKYENTVWLKNILHVIHERGDICFVTTTAMCQITQTIAEIKICDAAVEDVLDRISKECIRRSTGRGVDQQGCCTLLRNYVTIWTFLYDDPIDTLVKSKPVALQFVNAMLKLAMHYMLAMPAAGLCQVLWSMAQLSLCDKQKLQAIEKRIIHLADNGALEDRDIANIVWSFATLHYYSAKLLERLADYTLCMSGKQLGEQAVSNIVMSYGFLNYNSTASVKMFEMLAGQAMPLISSLQPQALVNIAWGFVCAEFYPIDFFEQWRGRVATEHIDFDVNELRQLHQIETALRLEAPHIGIHSTSLNVDYTRYLDQLYQMGRRAFRAQNAWQSRFQVRHGRPSHVSPLQKQVYKTIVDLGFQAVLEYDNEEYSIDVAVPSLKIAIEVDGPVHFCWNKVERLTGPSKLKDRLLKQLGWSVVRVPYFAWSGPKHQKQAYIREQLVTVDAFNRLQNLKSSLIAENKEETVLLNSPEQTSNRLEKLALMEYAQGKLSKSQLILKKALRQPKP